MMDPLLPWLMAALVCVAVAAWTVYDRFAPARVRQRARDLMQSRAGDDREARLILWDGRGNGGIGVVEYPRGSVQAHYEKGVYRMEWFGRRGHPVEFDHLVTSDAHEFTERLRMWTSRGHVHRQDHFRAGPMMAI